jgi:hypothetical protein
MKFAICHTYGHQSVRLSVTKAEEERSRIVGIIQSRIDIHRSFINFCMDNDVQVTPSIFSAIVELRALLRKIECQ